jgi:hypothetical protein
VSRTDFAKARRVVVKIGSSLLTKGGQGLDKVAIAAWVKQMAGVGRQQLMSCWFFRFCGGGHVSLGLKSR